MVVATLQIRLHAPWVHSLKEKRMVVKSLVAKLRGKYNISCCETGDQDLHQSILLGIAAAAAHTAQADSILDHILDFIEENTEAQLMEIQRELR